MADTLADDLARANVKDDRVVSFEDQGKKLDDSESAEEVVIAIETCPNMEILCLAGNTLGVDAAQDIANALQSRPTLKYALWKDMFTGRLRAEIPASLRALSNAMIVANTQLVELDLSDNAFGPDGAEAIRALLTSPVAYTIETLKFQNNGLGGGGVIIADCLKENHARALREDKCLQLKTFIAGRNRLENEGAKALGEAFALLGTLQQIEVIQNGIQYDGICGLAQCISPSLRILNLNDNIMTPRGAVAIAAALPRANNLEVLNLGDCLVKSEGALAIADAIKDLANLKDLILSFNEINADGGVALAKVCSELPSLKTLNLDGNHFGDIGKSAVEEALGDRLGILTGLNEDEGIPSDDEEDEEEEKKDSPEKTKAASPFIFGQPSPPANPIDPNRTFGGFLQPAQPNGFSFSSVSAGVNIFAKKDGQTDHTFRGSGTALFSGPSTDEHPENEVDVQFEPLVHLEKIEKTTTGEENEIEAYKHRAKIFRFDLDAQAWKERGVGDLRILTNKTTNKSRLIMRRDLIWKICCNHLITKQMEMKPNAGSDKSLVWFTQADFVEEEPRPENLAVRFKTPEICGDFLKAFNEAKAETPEPGSTPQKSDPPKIEPPKPATPTPEPPKEDPSQPFSFASLAANAEKAAFAAKSPQNSPVKPTNADKYREEYEPEDHFEPLVSLQKLVTFETGTEEEQTKFSGRSKLYRFDKETNQWKERGLGELSVLWHKETGKGRILMRREHILKICCNHSITSEMELKNHQGNDKFLVWHTFADYADEEPKFEQLAAKFKTSEIAAEFKNALESCQKDLGKIDRSEDDTVKSATEAINNLSTKPDSGGMADLIAKQKDKWTCSTCALKNDKTSSTCLACQTRNPDAPPDKTPDKTTSSSAAPSFTFGVPSGNAAASPSFTFGCSSGDPPPTSGFTFGTAPAPASDSFSFAKPAAGFQFGTTPVKSPVKEEPKPSPFAGFSFGGTTKPADPTPGFTFGGVKTAGTPSLSSPTIDYKIFIAEPSSSTLEQILSPEGVSSALDCTSPSHVALFVGKLSRVMSNQTENTSKQIVDCVLSTSFSHNDLSSSDFTNELLVTMGLIKSEDKDFKPEADVGNMLRLLSHAVKQPYFPKSNAKIVSTFIKKDMEKLSNKIRDCTEILSSFQI